MSFFHTKINYLNTKQFCRLPKKVVIEIAKRETRMITFKDEKNLQYTRSYNDQYKDKKSRKNVNINTKSNYVQSSFATKNFAIDKSNEMY